MRGGDVDIVDETFVRADQPAVRRALDALGLPATGRQGWPDGCVTVAVEDRGPKGVRWRSEGPLAGRMEIWLEPVPGGTIVHHYVQARTSDRWRSPSTVARRHAHAWKREITAIKDELEGRGR